MLPFLGPKKISSVIVAGRKPDGSLNPQGDEGEMDAGLMSAAEDLIQAVHAKDATAVASALKAAFQMSDDDSDVEMGE